MSGIPQRFAVFYLSTTERMQDCNHFGRCNHFHLSEPFRLIASIIFREKCSLKGCNRFNIATILLCDSLRQNYRFLIENR